MSAWGDMPDLDGLVPVFLEEDCTCPEPHPITGHDDGFGCTVPGCPCLAQWAMKGAGDA